MVNEKIIVELSAEIKGLKSQLNTAQSDLKSFAQANKQTSDNIQNSFDNAKSSIKSLVLGYIGLQAATQAVGRAFNESLRLDAVKSAFTAILGSTELAEAQLEKISQTAEYLGLNFLDLATSYKNFAAASISSNQTLGDTNKIFDAVTRSAATLKLSSEDVKGALNALGQMFSKGTVSAEELKQQLGERLPGAVALMAQGLGVTTQALNKMLEQGQITTAGVIKLAEQLELAYGSKITGKVDTLQASVQRLNNTFTTAVESGNLGKFFKLIVDGANRALNGLELMIKGLKNPGKSYLLIELEEGLQSYLDLIRKVNATPITKDQSQKDLVLAQGLINAAIEKNVHLLVYAENQFGKNSEVTKNYSSNLDDLYKKLKKVNGLITPGGPAIVTGTTKTKRPAPGSNMMMPMSDLTDAKAGIAAQELEEFNAVVERLTGNVNTLKTSYNELFTDPAIEAYNRNLELTIGLLGNALTNAFDDALNNGKNFFASLGQALLALIKKLIIAAAVAALLAFLLGGFGAASSVAGFAPIFKQLSGLDFSQGSASGSRIAMPSASTGQGGYQVDIMGDKMRMLLDNTAIKNSRVI
jgi:tape measure domain-containing protein